MFDHHPVLEASPDALRATNLTPAASLAPRPSMAIGRGYGSHPLPLGLDRPLQLQGGDALGTDLVMDLPLDWVDGLTSRIGNACKAQLEAGRNWFSLPSFGLECQSRGDALLVGRVLAGRTGVPLIELDLSSASHDTATLPMWESILPPKLILAMAAFNCANPIVVVTGQTEARPGACEALATMLDPHTATTWHHPPMEAVFDLGAITWIVEVANRHDLHAPLYGLLDKLHCKSEEHPTFEIIRRVCLVMAALDECKVEPQQISSEGQEFIRENIFSPSGTSLPFSLVQSMIEQAAQL